MLKNAAIYMSGSVLAQVVMLIAIPILSRLYPPDAFGVFGLFSALLSVSGVAACLRYELAIPLPESKRQAAQVFATGCIALLCTTTTMLVVVAFARHRVAEWLEAPALAQLLWFLPASMLGYGLYELLNYWSTRHGRFRALAISHVFRAAGVTGTQFGLSSNLAGGSGLVIGQLTGQWVANAVLGWQTLRNHKGLIASAFRARRIRKQAQRYRSFPMHGAPQAILNSASQTIPAIMLGWFFSPTVVGLYIMAQRVVSAPMSLISQSLRQAMLPHFSRQRQSGRPLTPLLRKYTAGLALAGFPIVLALAFFGEALFGLVLGEQWAQAGQYAGWLVLWLWAGMINPPSIVVLTVLEKQRLQAIYEFSLLVARIAALGSALWTQSPLVTVAAFSLVGFAFNLALIAIAFTKCKSVDLSKAQ